MENEKQEDLFKLFEVTKEDLEKIKDIRPPFTVEVNKSRTVKVLEDVPREVRWVDIKGREKKGRVIAVEDVETEEELSLWLTPITLRVRIAKIYAKRQQEGKTLKGCFLKIGKKLIEHDDYGEIPVYWVKEITEAEAIGSTNEEY
jgi:uncharacterized membrane protein YvbJ